MKGNCTQLEPVHTRDPGQTQVQLSMYTTEGFCTIAHQSTVVCTMNFLEVLNGNHDSWSEELPSLRDVALMAIMQ